MVRCGLCPHTLTLLISQDSNSKETRKYCQEKRSSLIKQIVRKKTSTVTSCMRCNSKETRNYCQEERSSWIKQRVSKRTSTVTSCMLCMYDVCRRFIYYNKPLNSPLKMQNKITIGYRPPYCRQSFSALEANSKDNIVILSCHYF